jgi:crossover junction endodeoxyribonuclease RuvC
MIILSLDLGTHCGWKIGDRELALSGVREFGNSRFEGGGMRFVKFVKSLRDLTVNLRPELVVYEEVRRHLSTDSAHVYGGLMATLTSWCEKEQFPYQSVPVQTIKKFATGKGNASKADVVAAVQSWGLQPRDDNEADAMALWEYAQREFGG